MSNDPLFCRKQADTERANAATSTLDNVRERCERAAKSWEVMAARAERTQKLRVERETRPDLTHPLETGEADR